ncbi:MAG: DUF4292 domain-containing protein [wastewater metagenome]|nr:DUF4292 domain-containing protein [Candidatus Loosdrechtia aerotolerans]
MKKEGLSFWPVSMKKYKYIACCLSLVGILLGSGCATYRAPAVQRSVWDDPSPILGNIQGEVKSLSLQQIWQILLTRNSNLNSFRANADIVLDTPDIKGSLRCRGLIVYQKPENLRIIGSKFTATLFDILSTGDKFWLYIPMEKKLYTGSSDTFHRIETLGINIFPGDIATLFNYKETLIGEKLALETWPTYWLVHLLDMDTKFVNLKGNVSLDRINAEVFRYDLFNPDGSVRLQALFTDYGTYDGCRIPQEVHVRWPRYETTLTITFSEVAVNISLDPKVFTPTISKKVQTIHLH